MTQALRRETAPAVIQPQSKVEVFVGQVLPPDRMGAVVASLPAHVKPERFERNLAIALSAQPKLLNCEPVAVFNEVCKAAALGLYLDPALGEAYLIAAWDSRAGREVPQLRIGYRGLAKLCRQSGEIKGTPYAHEVCENDQFHASFGAHKDLVHEPDFDAERGAVRLFYAVVKFDDGEVDFEVMNIAQVERIRDRSDGWRAFKAGKIKSTPWSTDFDEMAKKTVLRKLLKRLPQSPEVAEALRIEDADYIPEDGPPRLTVVERLRIAKAKNAPEGFDPAHVAAELDGDEKPTTAAPEPAEDTSDFPGDKPMLSQRADGYEKRLREATTTIKLRSIYNANSGLRDDLDRSDPERGVELENLFNELFAALEDAEREAAQ